MTHIARAAAGLLLIAAVSNAQTASTPRQRARELALSAAIGGTPGMLDGITDVAGVEVGHTTLISGSGRLEVGQGPVRPA